MVRRFLSFMALSEHRKFHMYNLFHLIKTFKFSTKQKMVSRCIGFRVFFCTDEFSAKKNVLNSGCLIVWVRVFPDFIQHFNIIISYEGESNNDQYSGAFLTSKPNAFSTNHKYWNLVSCLSLIQVQNINVDYFSVLLAPYKLKI